MQKHPLLRLFQYSRQHRKHIVGATIFSVLNKIFDIAPPALIGVAVDIMVQREDSFIAQLGFPDLSQQLIILAIITFIIWFFESLFQYFHQIVWRNLAQRLEHEMRMDAYQHIQSLELAYFEDQSTGHLMSILNDDINQLERFLDRGANDLIQVTTTIVVIGGIFFAIAPTVAWLALIPMPFIVYGSVLFQRRLAPRYKAVREQVGMLNHQLSNSLSGMTTIKSFTAEGHEVERIRQSSDAYQAKNRWAIRLSAAFSPVIRMVIVAGFIAILIFGGQLTLDGELAVGLYSIMIFMTQRLLWPLTTLGETFDQYQRAMASIDRILNLLDIEPTIVDGEQALALADVEGHLEFRDVRFEYGNGQQVIHGLSLDIPIGDTVAIVGATGAGKSTIVKLMLRFYDVISGAICLDGYDLRDLKLHDLRSAIGLVSQDVFLFHGTVRENITYGTFSASDEAIIQAAKIAEAHDFILSLPEGYDTVVGERGQKLSGGQRQRISIARAILKNPPILIFDEATSSVDNETEAAIQRSLEKVAVGRTTVIIAHRLSTVRHSDQIFVLDGGQLAEQGTHEELLAEQGIYEALWRVQMGEREVKKFA